MKINVQFNKMTSYITHEIFRILPVFSQFLRKLTFIFAGPMRNCTLCYYRLLIISIALEKFKEECDIV